ncbi:MAG TPA: diacylglycerol kinase family protein [Gemmatimonadales bacterium]|nr:diacylglycerol kinase family protein [Gemmatimonadales bacterium]
MLHATVILNPAAGHGAAWRARESLARAFRRAGWSVDIVPTERPGHATELARAAAQSGARCLIAVGGDGAVHEVANGLLAARASTALGVVPIGTGNDFAKLTGVYRHSVERAVSRLVTATTARFDAGKVLGEFFVNTLGFGFGPAVVQTRSAMPGLKGFLSYLVPVLRTFATFRPPLLEVRADGYEERGNMMMVEVCNGTTAGGSYRFAPDADPRDGMLDVCIIRKIGLLRFLAALPRVMRGTHEGMKEVTLVRTGALVIRSPEAPLVLHLDGELRTPPPEVRECTVTVERGCLNVLVAR